MGENHLKCEWRLLSLFSKSSHRNPENNYKKKKKKLLLPQDEAESYQRGSESDTDSGSSKNLVRES